MIRHVRHRAPPARRLDDFVAMQLCMADAMLSHQLALVGHDRDLRIVYWGPHVEAMLGLRAEEVLGRVAPDVFPFLDEYGETALARQALDGKLTWSEAPRPFAEPMRRRAGYYESRFSPMRDRGGSIVGVTALLEDVTERCELIQRLRETETRLRSMADASEDQLRETIRAREDFLSIASHELRTPLTALTLSLDVLLRNARRQPFDDQDALVREAARAASQARRLEELVQDLLAATRLRSGRLELELRTVDLGDVVAASVGRLGEALRTAGCALSFERGAPVAGRWDASLLERVVTKLLSNALKYGSGKPVGVEVRDEGDRAVLTVSDQGIGITARDQARIFEPFERGVSSRNYGGLGLGLWIARESVRRHGGSIQVTSVPGHGAAFTVSLPREVVPERVAALDGRTSR